MFVLNIIMYVFIVVFYSAISNLHMSSHETSSFTFFGIDTSSYGLKKPFVLIVLFYGAGSKFAYLLIPDTLSFTCFGTDPVCLWAQKRLGSKCLTLSFFKRTNF